MTDLTDLILNLFHEVNDIYHSKTGPFIGAYSDVTFKVVKIEAKSSSCVQCHLEAIVAQAKFNKLGGRSQPREAKLEELSLEIKNYLLIPSSLRLLS